MKHSEWCLSLQDDKLLPCDCGTSLLEARKDLFDDLVKARRALAAGEKKWKRDTDRLQARIDELKQRQRTTQEKHVQQLAEAYRQTTLSPNERAELRQFRRHASTKQPRMEQELAHLRRQVAVTRLFPDHVVQQLLLISTAVRDQLNSEAGRA